MVGELETRLERLRHLYDQYFLGYEKLEPQVPRKDVERRVEVLRREQIRNTALRFRFTVVTQKLNTYQSLWHRTCRAIEDGTFKRHLQKAQKRFGPGAANNNKKSADLDLDIDVDLGELEAEVASDLDAISEEERRILAKVEAELRGDGAGGDTERPAAAPAKRRIVEDDEGEDLPTNRPPASMDIADVAIPKSPNIPSVERTHTAAPFGNTRPNIRKTDPGAARASARAGRNTPPPFDPRSPVMPKVPSAHPPAMRESASKIALPAPARESANIRAAYPTSTSMRLAPPGSASSMRAAAPAHAQDGAREAGTDVTDRSAHDGSAGRSSGQMRAALPVPGTSLRMPPPGAQSRMAPPGARTSPGTSSQSMRAAPPTITSPGNPGGPPSSPSIRLPPPGASARGSLPMPGGTKVTGDIPPMRPRAPSVGNSKPPPPLPSTITQRNKQPSLADLAADAKDKDKK